MAKVVLGLATSHGPQLLTLPQYWSLREEADRKNSSLHFGGQVYRFDRLAQHRSAENIAELATAQARQAHFDRCQAGMAKLRDVYAQAQPDVAVILGNDQFEVFTEVNIPAFSVFWGEFVDGIPKTPEQRALIPAGAAFAEDGYCLPQLTRYPCQPQLGRYLIEQFISAEFDVAQSTRLPVGRLGNNGVPHAYGYIYRQVMRDRVIPHVPVMINTHNPPNRPTAARCLDFGRALGLALDRWPTDLRVAVIASGGLTHYVIDEGLDREFLGAAQAGDHKRIVAIPENRYEAGTAEIKNWLPLVGAMDELGLPMTLVDYVPCYRSEAGTGNAMGFAYWNINS